MTSSVGDNVVHKRGFTLTDLVVVLIIVFIAVALFIPSIQESRGTARRAQCNNNLKQLGLAFHNYHDTFKVFPPGGMAYQAAAWPYNLLPFIEQDPIFQRLAFYQGGGAPGTTVQMTSNGGNTQSVDNLTVLRGFKPSLFYCPSSPMEPVDSRGVCLPSYVGISGAAHATPPAIVSGLSLYRSVTGDYGITSSGGILVPNRPTRINEITDGLSATLLLGEQSNWVKDPVTSIQYDGRSSAGTAGRAQGLMCGPLLQGYPRSPQETVTPTWTGANQTWNLTATAFPINDFVYNPAQADGKFIDGGPNKAVQSAHHGSGAFFLISDGSARFVSSSLDMTVYKNQSCKSDRRYQGGF